MLELFHDTIKIVNNYYFVIIITLKIYFLSIIIIYVGFSRRYDATSKVFMQNNKTINIINFDAIKTSFY